MTVRKIHWKRPRPPKRWEYVNELSPAEQVNVKRALVVLRERYGGTKPLADAMKITPKALAHMFASKRRQSAGVALRVARLAWWRVEDVLNGRCLSQGGRPR